MPVSVESTTSSSFSLCCTTTGANDHIACVARADIKTGDNWHPDLKLIEQMLASSSSADGSLSLEDYAQYRVVRETTLPSPFTGLRSFFTTGEIGLVLPFTSVPLSIPG